MRMSKTETIINDENPVAWLGLREIFRLLGTEEGHGIIKILLDEGEVQSSELQIKSKVPASKFHQMIKALVTCLVVEREVYPDRHVSYKISTFGKDILELSKPLLNEIKEKFEQSPPNALLTALQNK